jgi:hypothetical protein
MAVLKVEGSSAIEARPCLGFEDAIPVGRSLVFGDNDMFFPMLNCARIPSNDSRRTGASLQGLDI